MASNTFVDPDVVRQGDGLFSATYDFEVGDPGVTHIKVTTVLPAGQSYVTLYPISPGSPTAFNIPVDERAVQVLVTCFPGTEGDAEPTITASLRRVVWANGFKRKFYVDA